MGVLVPRARPVNVEPIWSGHLCLLPQLETAMPETRRVCGWYVQRFLLLVSAIALLSSFGSLIAVSTIV